MLRCGSTGFTAFTIRQCHEEQLNEATFKLKCCIHVRISAFRRRVLSQISRSHILNLVLIIECYVEVIHKNIVFHAICRRKSSIDWHGSILELGNGGIYDRQQSSFSRKSPAATHRSTSRKNRQTTTHTNEPEIRHLVFQFRRRRRSIFCSPVSVIQVRRTRMRRTRYQDTVFLQFDRYKYQKWPFLFLFWLLNFAYTQLLDRASRPQAVHSYATHTRL